MSGIYIKGLKMPRNCMECKFHGFDRAKGKGNICIIDESITLHAVLDGVDVKFVTMGDCPLIEIPEHGDLIEKDKVNDIICEVCDGWLTDDARLTLEGISYTIEDEIPVIIPAERSEDGET